MLEPIELRHSGHFNLHGVSPCPDLTRASGTDACDLVGDNRLMLRSSAALSEERILILASPFKDSVLKRQRWNAVFARSVQASDYVIVKVIHTQDDIRQRFD